MEKLITLKNRMENFLLRHQSDSVYLDLDDDLPKNDESKEVSDER